MTKKTRTNESIYAHMNHWQKQYDNAVASWDGKTYIAACNELGRDPTEVPDLYEEGQIQISLEERITSTQTPARQNKNRHAATRQPDNTSTNTNPQEKYFAQLSKQGDSTRVQDYIAQRNLINKCFPGRFGEDEGQINLNDKTPGQVNKIYRELSQHYIKKYKL
ncbi:hypothetical protein K9M74_02865 [Candidatus Woesearchaeota archaeon]|nr:hypothetical protein [Candidatus Woesearchaeota archaeon]